MGINSLIKQHIIIIATCYITSLISYLGDSVIPKKGKSPVLKIVQRYYFSPALKRMSVVAGYNVPGSSETHYMATVKGAPETLKYMVGENNILQF